MSEELHVLRGLVVTLREKADRLEDLVEERTRQRDNLLIAVQDIAGEQQRAHAGIEKALREAEKWAR